MSNIYSNTKRRAAMIWESHRGGDKPLSVWQRDELSDAISYLETTLKADTDRTHQHFVMLHESANETETD